MNTGAPNEFQRILDKAIDKDRDLRYNSAAELRTDLKRLKRDTSSGKISRSSAQISASTGPASTASAAAAAAQPSSRGTLAWFAGAAALLLLLAFSGYAGYRLRRHPAQRSWRSRAAKSLPSGGKSDAAGEDVGHLWRRARVLADHRRRERARWPDFP